MQRRWTSLRGFTFALAAVAVGVAALSCEGPTGPQGPAGISFLETATAVGMVPAANDPSVNTEGTGRLRLQVTCRSGKQALGGGYFTDRDGAQFVYAYRSFPSAPGAWSVELRSSYTAAVAATAYAMCATVIFPPD
jgi:hypothetical protein